MRKFLFSALISLTGFMAFSQMTVTPSSGCSGSTFNITITGLNVANISSVCGTVATGGLTVNGNVVINATLSTSGSTGASGTLTIPANFTAGSYGFKVTAGCNNVVTTCSNCFTVTTTPAQPGTISGPTSPCVGVTNDYSISLVTDATSYTWTTPNTWTGGSATNSLSTTAGATGGVISVTANNACGSSSAQTLNVTVSDVPAQPSITAIGPALTSSSNLATQQWYLDGNSIPNATGNTYTATQTGSYTVVATNSCGNSLASAAVQVTVIGLEQTSLGLVKVYPNPVNDILMIQNTSGETLRIELFTIEGKLADEISVKETGSIDMSNLTVGIYTVKISNGKQVRIEKITKL